ncbi:phage virion morphogenesis protein [Acidovorax sp. SUPP1855]|uniref:phage virion morphogenesis protein n=1 Tax=Acidovorax sp. SUPP1855 TaxID=431774 RepID=UPI0023DE5DC6|nr:phage virion morphogenesis protein [Acidovorax sp. SUPP1855]GKS83212.1 phage virion morphogenesis protein [Acidovorax sp. SUPP1855]
MDDLQRLEDWVAPLLARLSAPERRALTRTVARELRKSNAASMRDQQAPDGTAWTPRKNKLRDQRGAIRAKAQAMFVKMRAAKYLQARGTPDEAVVQFAGRADRIARVHHFGLRDRVKPGGPEYDYPARPLLGITDAQMERVRDLLMQHLATKG